MNSHQRRGSWRWWKSQLLAGKCPGADRFDDYRQVTGKLAPYFKSRILAMPAADAIEFAEGILEVGRQRSMTEPGHTEELDRIVARLHWTEMQALFVVTRAGNCDAWLDTGGVSRLAEHTAAFLLGAAHVLCGSFSPAPAEPKSWKPNRVTSKPPRGWSGELSRSLRGCAGQSSSSPSRHAPQAPHTEARP